MLYVEKNIKIFEETRKKSKELINNGYPQITESRVTTTPNFRDCRDLLPLPKIKVINDDVISIARKMKAELGEPVAILNLADALVPGGLVLEGANTQEECICRQTTLYESLITDNCKAFYYDENAEAVKMSGDYTFTDNAIISPHVYTVDDLTEFQVVTIPAPVYTRKVAKYLKDIMLTRIHSMMWAFGETGCKNLVLGAFGCGAFGNDPRMVAPIFKNRLQNFAFDNVWFAIRADGPTGINNYEVFYETFREVLV